MMNDEIYNILKKHQKWLNNEEGGEHADLRWADLEFANLRRADLRYADLNDANLRHADLRYADLNDANLRRADLRYADLNDANLRHADLRYADLNDANLRHADLRYANLDYSCLSLSCKSLKAQFDDKQLAQIAYHLVKAGLQSKNASDETKRELSKLIDFANQFHKVKDCGLVTEESEIEESFTELNDMDR